MGYRTEIDKNLVVTVKEISLVLGLCRRRIHQLAAAGLISRVRRNRYNLCETVSGYARHLRKQNMRLQRKGKRRKKATVKIPTYSIQQAIEQSLREFAQGVRELKKKGVE